MSERDVGREVGKDVGVEVEDRHWVDRLSSGHTATCEVMFMVIPLN